MDYEVTLRLETSQISGVSLKDNKKTQTVIFCVIITTLLAVAGIAMLFGIVNAIEGGLNKT